MKIEFPCPLCDRFLRVPSIHVGHAMTCPACESALLIPDPAVDSRATHIAGAGFSEPVEPVWAPQRVSLAAILQDTWRLYIENLWLLVAVSLIDLVLWIVGIVLAIVPAIGTFAVLINAIGVWPPVAVVAMVVVLAIGGMTLINAMTCTQTKFFLKVARGEPASVLDTFQIGWKKGEVSMLPTIFGVISLSGLLICLVPGVFVYVVFWPYAWVWADKQTGGQDSQAFPLSKDLTSRNISTSLAIAAIGVVMTIFGLKFFGQSLFGMLKAVAYLHMSGQEVTGLAPRYPLPQLSFDGADPA